METRKEDVYLSRRGKYSRICFRALTVYVIAGSHLPREAKHDINGYSQTLSVCIVNKKGFLKLGKPPSCPVFFLCNPSGSLVEFMISAVADQRPQIQPSIEQELRSTIMPD